jgi:hypothetical protein
MGAREHHFFSPHLSRRTLPTYLPIWAHLPTYILSPEPTKSIDVKRLNVIIAMWLFAKALDVLHLSDLLTFQ